MINYYQILEISITASADEVKKAYRLKAIKYHPDKHFGDKYFSEKFIEIKEAYNVLSNDKLRAEYDSKYKVYLDKINESKQQYSFKEQKRKEKEQEEQFFYDPYKAFYSHQDRIVNETPQFNPKINHWGEKLPSDVDFFILPKKIGKIISGYSTLRKSMEPKTGFFKWFYIFEHKSSFIGVNGFAYYEIKKNRKNITKAIEVNFNEITDLFIGITKKSFNFNYDGTNYGFEWSNNNTIVEDITGSYYDKKDNPDREESLLYWTNRVAERYWTVYLLDRMEKELDNNGYIEFRILDNGNFKPYIRLGIGFITFLEKESDITYNFNTIKKAYIKGSKLFFEHDNYEKKFVFFESGNKNGIELSHLSNRQFFLKALEILLGLKFG